MKYVLFILYVLGASYSIHAMKPKYLPEKFEHTNIAQRINILKKRMQIIFDVIQAGIISLNHVILKQQIQQIPHINQLTSLFVYSYEDLPCKCFAAQMEVDVELTKIDIQLCIQAITEKYNTQKHNLPVFAHSLKLGLTSILNNLNKREKEEKEAYLLNFQ